MAVYDIFGNELASIYDINGVSLDVAYDIEGNIVFSGEDWYSEITVNKYRDNSASTNYYVINIPQTRPNGNKQYPFVFVPNGANGGTMSTLTMMHNYSFYMATNGGYFDYAQNHTNKPYGITIQNGAIIREDYTQFTNNYTLTIDDSGKLGYADKLSNITGQQLLENGAMSSILGLVPLVIDGDPSDVESSWWTSSDRIQRQIIGQYPNGDYCVITCEGRNFDNSQGFTVSEARTLCVNMGLDFAMAVDGGGSTETVVGEEQLNVIYEGTYGRIVPTYIVFNGTDTFGN